MKGVSALLVRKGKKKDARSCNLAKTSARGKSGLCMGLEGSYVISGQSSSALKVTGKLLLPFWLFFLKAKMRAAGFVLGYRKHAWCSLVTDCCQPVNELLFVCLKLTLSSSFTHKGATKPMCIVLVAAPLDARFGGGGGLAWGCANPLVQGWSYFISI